MKNTISMLLGTLLLASCSTQHAQRDKFVGETFDIPPGLYAETSANGKRLSVFSKNADCIISSTCHQGMSVRDENGEWKCRLSTDEFRKRINAIPNKNLAVVNLSQYDHLEELKKQNNQVKAIAQEYPFREIIILKDDYDGIRLEKYIKTEPPPAGDVLKAAPQE
jgi:hypothetical protein